MKRVIISLMIILLYVPTIFAQTFDYNDKIYGGSENGVVGKIEDEYEVNPNGQFLYTIPIKNIISTGGMSPCLSISYSSSNKNGLCGYGFDLSGLSFISRVPANLHIDGFVNSVEESNQFALDGNRLILQSSYANERVYYTRNNSYSKVVSYGTQENPSRFIVYTKDGLIYNYESDVALGCSTGKSIKWAVTRVMDTKGNYYTISYKCIPENNELLPDVIKFTGNDMSGLKPYASIDFVYMHLTADEQKGEVYIGGRKMIHSQIISTIRLKYEEQLVRELKFVYQKNKTEYQLSKITECTPNSHKNPTIFEWKNNPSFSPSNAILFPDDSEVINKSKYISGDFNGDGKQDLLAYPKNPLLDKGFYVLTSIGDGKYSKTRINYHDYIEKIIVGDFDGDGLTDLVIKTFSIFNVKKSCSFLKNTCTGGRVQFSEPVKIVNEGDFDFKRKYEIKSIEVTGDGAADVMIYHPGSNDYLICYSQSNDSSVSPLSLKYFGTINEDFENVYVGDYNGDGITDMLNCYEDGHTVYFCYNKVFFQEVSSSSFPTKNHYIYTGDFNCDGKTDILLTGYSKDPNISGWDMWLYGISDGLGSFVKKYNIRLVKKQKQAIFIADFNGDGYDDIFSVPEEMDISVNPNIYINNGKGFTAQEVGISMRAVNRWDYCFADINGDGRADIIASSNDESINGINSFIIPKGHDNLLIGITDGLGNTTQIDYGYMNSSLVASGTNRMYPTVSFTGCWPVVSSVSIPDGRNGILLSIYSYKNPIINKRGGGVLGFEEITKKDRERDVTEVSTYGYDPKEYVPYLKKVSKKVNNKVVSELHYTYEVKCMHPKGVFSLNPITIVDNKFEYNSGTLISETVTHNKFDAHGNVINTKIICGDNINVIENVYKDDENRWLLGRLVKSCSRKSNTNGAISYSCEYKYDSISGMLVEEHIDPEQYNGYKIVYSHDSFGNNIATKTIPNNDPSDYRLEKCTYDSLGRIITSTSNSKGFTTNYVVDEKIGVIKSSKDANGIQIFNSYDEWGNIYGTNAPLTNSVNITGWSAGMPDAPMFSKTFVYKKELGRPWQIEFYDCVGRLLRKVTPSINGKKIYVDNIYNSIGELISTTAPYFKGSNDIYSTEYTYDAVGRITSECYQTKASSIKYEFDYNGFITTSKDPLGRVSQKIQDSQGNTERAIDACGNVIMYKYDANGHAIEVVGPRTTIKNTYDNKGNRIKIEDPDIGVQTAEYDGLGQLISTETANGITKYKYDELGRCVQKITPDGTINSSYDGSRKGAVDIISSNINGVTNIVEYKYDNNGNIVSQISTINGISKMISFSYNSMNLKDIVCYPDNHLRIKYNYDENGVLLSVIDMDTNKPFWNIKEVNARGQISEECFGNGLHTKTSYDDSRGTCDGISTLGIQNLAYTYNEVGNITSRIDKKHNLQEDFFYDELDRLRYVKQNLDTVQSVCYDNAGNIVSKTDVGEYKYDANSNRLLRIVNGSYHPILWDEIKYTSFNKVYYVASAGNSLKLGYGADFKRCYYCRKNENNDNVEVYYFNGYYEQSYDKNIVTDKYYVYVNNIAIALIENKSNVSDDMIYYIHHDNLGSIQALTDEKGRLVQEMSYDVWGRRRNSETWKYFEFQADARVKIEYGFCGHEHIDIFEMIDMDGRMYDPIIGRFMSPDPSIQNPDFSQSLNRYAYCLNNPLSLTDPTGYNWFSRNWKIVFSSIAAIAVTYLTAGTTASLGVAMLAGAAGGATGSMTYSVLNGANIFEVAKNTFTGAFWGAIGGAASFGCGEIAQIFKESKSALIAAKVLSHAASNSLINGAQGGNMLIGAFCGAFSSFSSSFMSNIGMKPIENVIISSIIGGTLSEIGGGKFANGAISAAFGTILNEYKHAYWVRRNFKFKSSFCTGMSSSKNRGGNANITQINGKYAVGNKIYCHIDEFHDPKAGTVKLDAIAYSKLCDNVTAGLEINIQCDNPEIDYSSNFTPQSSQSNMVGAGGEIYLGEFHTKNIFIRDATVVKITLSPGYIYNNINYHTSPGLFQSLMGRQSYRIK